MDTVEALAARCALTFAQEISIFRAEVEGYSFKVVSAINNSELNRSHLGHIILDIQSASQCMHFCHFIHVRRG